VRACVQRGHAGPYQIQAAINAVHSIAPSFDSTDWRAILTLYDQLYALTPGEQSDRQAVDQARTTGMLNRPPS
jgi:predicted RNA polymerase sigma factor